MIKLTPQGVTEISDFIKSIPRGMKIAAMRAIGEYYVEKEGQGLRREPTYKHFSYKSIYGGWQSRKQQGYVMAKIRSGEIVPGTMQRTHAIRDSWVMHDAGGDWRRVNIEGKAPGIDYVKGEQQARMPKEIGWTKATQDIIGGLANALRAGQRAVDALIARKGK